MAITIIVARMLQLSLTLYWYKRISNLRFRLSYLYPLMAFLGVFILLAGYINTVYADVHWLVYLINLVPLLILGLFVVFYLFAGNVKSLISLDFKPIRQQL